MVPMVANSLSDPWVGEDLLEQRCGTLANRNETTAQMLAVSPKGSAVLSAGNVLARTSPSGVRLAQVSLGE